MALLNAKLYVKRNGEAAVPCNLYSTTEEVGGEYVTVTASNTKAYAKLGGGHLMPFVHKLGSKKVRILMRF